MRKLTQYTLTFEGSIYNARRNQKYITKGTIQLDDEGSVACIKNVGDGCVVGYVRCCAEDGDESKVESLESQLFGAMRLKGLVFKESRKPELTWVTGDGRQCARVVQGVNSQYSIEARTTTLYKDDVCDINKLLKEIRADKELEEFAIELLDKEQYRIEEGVFARNWIEFNKKYGHASSSEQSRIECHIMRLQRPDILFHRNKKLFNILAGKQFILKNGINVSDELNNSMNKNDARDSVKWAALCVYSLRNELFHKNILKFEGVPQLIDFLRDLIYAEQIAKCEAMNVRILYNAKQVQPST